MEAKHGSSLDLKSDLDFPSLGSNVVPPSSKPTQEKKALPLQNSNKENSQQRSTSKGRGKKQNWKSVQVEFTSNSSSNGPRYNQQRGLSSRPRFGSSHVTPKNSSSDDPPFEFSYRGYRSGSRSRIRRARGGSAPHHFGRPTSVESNTPSSHSPTSDLSPTIVAIPYHPNYGAYVQQQIAAESPADIEEAIRHQIEYYFSEENLIKDNYMRLNMTSEGFLSIQLISNFNKIKQFNTDIDTIARAIEASDKLEVVDGKMVRPVIDPLRWPLVTPLPPPVTSLMKNYVQPEVIVANGTLYQEVVPELDVMYQPELVVAAPVTDLVYQEPIEDLSGYMGGLTFDEKAMYAAEYYPDQQTFDQDPQTFVQDFDPCYAAPEDICQTEQTVATEPEEEVSREEEQLTNGHHTEENESHQEDIVDTVSLTITDKVSYRYAPEPKDCQKDIGFQQEVGHYQHMFAYVSS